MCREAQGWVEVDPPFQWPPGVKVDPDREGAKISMKKRIREAKEFAEFAFSENGEIVAALERVKAAIDHA